MVRCGLILLCAAVLLGHAAPADAAFPGRNGRIAFVQHGDIYTVRPDGTRLRRVARNAGQPAFSRSGRTIAFAAWFDRDFGGFTFPIRRIEIVRTTGSGRTRLTRGDDDLPSWAPDGRRLVFRRYHPCLAYGSAEEDCPARLERSRNHGILIYRRGETRVLTRHAENSGAGPVWSPSGRLIAFTREGISVIRPDGSGLRRVTNTSGGTLDWSPDGRRIIFDDLPLTSRTFFISSIRPDGRGLQRLTTNGSSPSVSPDGRWIVFQRAYRRCFRALWIMRSAGSRARVLRYPSGRPICGVEPDWQPAGNAALSKELPELIG